MASDISKSWWANLVLYGFSLGLLLAALQYSQFRLLTFGRNEKWYFGLIAVIFAAIGIWAGRKLNKKNDTTTDARPPFKPREEILEQMGITPRELEVLEQMAQGLSNQEIAEKLFVSLNTIKTHTSNLFAKLDAQRRTQAIQRGKELGLIP